MEKENMISKETVKRYWENKLPSRLEVKNHKFGTDKFFDEYERLRYCNDGFNMPWLYETAEFRYYKGKKVLEIGIGTGTDILQFARHGAICSGIDLTENAIKYTKQRFKSNGLKGNILKADFHKLPFDDNTFDLVYSFGVIHHCLNMKTAVNEIYRVLKPNGKAIVMIYGKGWEYYFFIPFFFGILKGELFKMSFDDMIHKHTEQFGNVPIVIYSSKKEASELFSSFENVEIEVKSARATLGNKFLKLNMLFCKFMNFVFGGNFLIIKGYKPLKGEKVRR
jgi:ubiquinone/menaquinone biosynthesis C-methylase UbiE